MKGRVDFLHFPCGLDVVCSKSSCLGKQCDEIPKVVSPVFSAAEFRPEEFGNVTQYGLFQHE